MQCQAKKSIAHSTLFKVAIVPTWGRYMADYLATKELPEDLPIARKRAIEVDADSYALIGGQLYKRGPDNNLRICAAENEYIAILEQAHKGISGGHFSAETTAKSILADGIWWPTLNLDVEAYVKACDECQRTKPLITRDNMPLRSMMGARDFAK